LPVYSLVSGVQTEYIIAGGKPTIRLKSTGGIGYRGAYTGVAVLLFHWVQQGKTRAWRFDPSIPEPQPIQPEEATDKDGSQLLTFTLRELIPAAGLLRGRWEGTFLAPAIHLDIPIGRDIWVFLLRSPWFPLELSLERQSLSATTDRSVANATLTLEPTGALSATISNPGNSFKKVSLMLKRKVGKFVSEELIGEVEAGMMNQIWRPIIRNFDLCLETSSSMSMGDLSEIARGLGARFSRGLFGPGSLDGDFLLCDGPLTEYSLTLRGDLGLFQRLEDSTKVKLTW
jgi:hypothetical protein